MSAWARPGGSFSKSPTCSIVDSVRTSSGYASSPPAREPSDPQRQGARDAAQITTGTLVGSRSETPPSPCLEPQQVREVPQESTTRKTGRDRANPGTGPSRSAHPTQHAHQHPWNNGNRINGANAQRDKDCAPPDEPGRETIHRLVGRPRQAAPPLVIPRVFPKEVVEGNRRSPTFALERSFMMEPGYPGPLSRLLQAGRSLVIPSAYSARSGSSRRLLMMNPCRSGVFLPM